MRHDVHAGTPALKALRMIVNLPATRDGRHRPRSKVFYDIVAAFVHASIDEVVGRGGEGSPRGPAGEVLLAVEGALWHLNGFKKAAPTLHESARNARVECEQSDVWFLLPPKRCWNVRMSRRRFHGRRQ